jgi:hypothetical protein
MSPLFCFSEFHGAISIKNSKVKSWTREHRALIPPLQPDGGLTGATG